MPYAADECSSLIRKDCQAEPAISVGASAAQPFHSPNVNFFFSFNLAVRKKERTPTHPTAVPMSSEKPRSALSLTEQLALLENPAPTGAVCPWILQCMRVSYSRLSVL